VRAKAGPGFDVQTMKLGIDPATGAVRWTVAGEGEGHARVFTAGSDASGLKRVG
jgi:hypothetical protein